MNYLMKIAYELPLQYLLSHSHIYQIFSGAALYHYLDFKVYNYFPTIILCILINREYATSLVLTEVSTLLCTKSVQQYWMWVHTHKDCSFPSFILFFYFTILCYFCHTSTCICHGCTRVPHPEPPSHLPPHTIPLGHPSAPAPSFLYPVLNQDWRFVSYMILYRF